MICAHYPQVDGPCDTAHTTTEHITKTTIVLTLTAISTIIMAAARASNTPATNSMMSNRLWARSLRNSSHLLICL
jgi:hypothetical protein